MGNLHSQIATLKGGTSVYYPGSHKLPIYGNEQLGLSWHNSSDSGAHYPAYEKLYPKIAEKFGLERQSFYAKKGQALIWAANLLHGGGQQKDAARTRWSQVTHYYFDNCIYYTPMTSDLGYEGLSYRSISDVANEEIKKHSFSGHEVSQEVLDFSKKGDILALPDDFDSAQYLAANPDVAASGVDAATHYLSYGRSEHRRLRP